VAVTNDFDNIWVHERLAADESDPHGTKFTNFPYPFFQIVEGRMRPAVVVLSAISTIEVTTIRHIKTALQRSAIEKTLTRFQNVIARKFAADLVESFMRLIGKFQLTGYLPRCNLWFVSLASTNEVSTISCSFRTTRVSRAVRASSSSAHR